MGLRGKNDSDWFVIELEYDWTMLSRCSLIGWISGRLIHVITSMHLFRHVLRFRMKDVTQVVTLKSVTNVQFRWHGMSPKWHQNMWHNMWLRKEDRIGGIGPRLPRCDYYPHIRGIQLCIAAQVARRACDTRDTQLWHTWHRPASNSDVFGLILTLSVTIFAWNSKFFRNFKVRKIFRNCCKNGSADY